MDADLHGPPLADRIPDAAAALVGSPIWRVLERARWAPSGDNIQPWRFRLLSPLEGEVLAFDTREQVVFDIDGSTCQLALGALLANLRLAAGALGHRAELATDLADERRIRVHVRLQPDPAAVADPLERWIEVRAVQRRPMDTTPLTAAERQALEAEAAAGGATLRWFASPAERRAVARLNWLNAGVRLNCPEAFAVLRQVIDWERPLSPDRLPVASIGLDPLTIRLMRWLMGDWKRMAFSNRFLAGTVPPRIQLDIIPSLRCAAHVAVLLPRPPQAPADHIAAGEAVQRLWLRLTALGLHLQPEYTPVCFSAYVRQERRFTVEEGVWRRARHLTAAWNALLGGEEAARRAVWLCRIGHGRAPSSRSVRLPFPRLLVA